MVFSLHAGLILVISTRDATYLCITHSLPLFCLVLGCPCLPKQEVNASQAARLDDAAQLLADKDRMEETIKKQHALIEQRGQELKVLKAQLDGKDAALDKARCATTTAAAAAAAALAVAANLSIAQDVT